MQKHIITKEQLDKDNNYIGTVDLENFKGHLEAEENLGYVKFKFLKIQGYIYFKAGSGIKAGGGIEAGLGIKAGDGIEAGSGIKAGGGIEAGLSIVAKFISSNLRIFAGICNWRIPTAEEMQIKAELRKGVIAFGKLIEPKKE